jgi:hypothetical protein
MIQREGKICGLCREWHQNTEFYVSVCAPDGRQGRCKLCCNLAPRKEYDRAYRALNKAKINAQQRQWRKAQKDRAKY